MEFTGERMTTEYGSYGSIEHLHRYSVAGKLLSQEMTVLDIACGEGYGTDFISKRAKRVIGVDISEEAILHAKEKYKAKNVEFIQAPATNIPLGDNIADMIVSFETLEHLEAQESMIKELKRLLKSDGILVISTPDKEYYNQGITNPFHVKELTFLEFKKLIEGNFSNVRFSFQKMIHGSLIFNIERPSVITLYEGDFNSIKQFKHVVRHDFIIATASNDSSVLPCLEESVFDASDIYENEKKLNAAIRERYSRIVKFRLFKYYNYLLKLFGSSI